MIKRSRDREIKRSRDQDIKGWRDREIERSRSGERHRESRVKSIEKIGIVLNLTWGMQHRGCADCCTPVELRYGQSSVTKIYVYKKNKKKRMPWILWKCHIMHSNQYARTYQRWRRLTFGPFFLLTPHSELRYGPSAAFCSFGRIGLSRYTVLCRFAPPLPRPFPPFPLPDISDEYGKGFDEYGRGD